jgi:hypothetical protein
MRGVALHGLDQNRHQIGSPAQLHIDAAPALAHEIALPDQTVEDPDAVDQDHQNDCGNEIGHDGYILAARRPSGL